MFWIYFGLVIVLWYMFIVALKITGWMLTVFVGIPMMLVFRMMKHLMRQYNKALRWNPVITIGMTGLVWMALIKG